MRIGIMFVIVVNKLELVTVSSPIQYGYTRTFRFSASTVNRNHFSLAELRGGASISFVIHNSPIH
ncbi:hypothetical protein VIBNISFn118_300096 [Vibrio nigripulchritudo SFn118]|nr:hypothetical protein VIBNISFn118_300096 [Vibrio nigripulchritudo SFn118]